MDEKIRDEWKKTMEVCQHVIDTTLDTDYKNRSKATGKFWFLNDKGYKTINDASAQLARFDMLINLWLGDPPEEL